MEEWKDLPGLEGLYQVSSYGRIRSLDRRIAVGGHHKFRTYRGRIIKPGLHTGGYLTCQLGPPGKKTPAYVHRLVAAAFIEKPEGKPHINHRDFDRKNNRVENLEYVAAGENIRYSASQGRYARPLSVKAKTAGENNGNAVLTWEDVTEIRERHLAGGTTGSALAREFGVDKTLISSVIRGLSWKEEHRPKP